jgi:hypothetical protein
MQRVPGAELMVAGGFLALYAGFGLLQVAPQKQIHAELESSVTGDAEGSARRARTQVASAATSNRQTRFAMQGLSVGLIAASIGASVVGFVRHESAGDDGEFLIAGGLAGVLCSSALLVASSRKSDVERMNDELHSPSFSAGIVPTRGGAVAGMAMTF